MVLIQLVPYLTDFLFLPCFSCLWTHLQTVYLREGRFPQGLNIVIKCIEKKALFLLIAWVACTRYQVRRNNYTRRQNGLKPKNAEIPSTSSLSRLLIKATKSQALLDKGQLSRKTWAWIIYLCIWNKSKRNKPYVLLLCGNAANCLWYAYGEKKWIGTIASDQKMGVEFV